MRVATTRSLALVGPARAVSLPGRTCLCAGVISRSGRSRQVPLFVTAVRPWSSAGMGLDSEPRYAAPRGPSGGKTSGAKAKKTKEVAAAKTSKTSKTSIGKSRPEVQMPSSSARAEVRVEAELARAKKAAATPPAPSLTKEPIAWVRSVPGRFWAELKHYYHGTRLLGLEVAISFRIMRRILHGNSLTRRERRQLKRTFNDLLRVVPMAMFLIIPFMEFLLPVALKLFPGMLPSTFEDQHKKEEAIKRNLKAKINLAKFLQESAVQFTQNKRDNADEGEDWEELMARIQLGAEVSHAEVLRFAQSFSDEYTLDHVSRAQLLAMCKFMGIPPYGYDGMLRLQLTIKLRQLKEDDRVIRKEGVEELSLGELKTALRARGMSTSSRSVRVLRRRLDEWLDLSLDHDLPESVLILSRAFLITEQEPLQSALKDTIGSLPEELVEEVMLDLGGESIPADEKVRILREQAELIEEEMEMAAEDAELTEEIREELAASKDAVDPVHEEATREVAQKILELSSKSAVELEREALKEMRSVASQVSAGDDGDGLEDRLTDTTLRTATDDANLAVEIHSEIASAEPNVESVSDIAADSLPHADSNMEDASETARKEEAARKAAEATKATGERLSARVDSMLEKLESELSDAEALIGEHFHFVDKDGDGVISQQELEEVAKTMKAKLSAEDFERVTNRLASHEDGRIVLEHLRQFLDTSLQDPVQEVTEEAPVVEEKPRRKGREGKSPQRKKKA